MTKLQKINIRVPYLFMASLLLFSLFAMISCEKDKLLEEQNTISIDDSELVSSKDIKPTGDGGTDGGNGDGPVLDCPNIKKRVYKNNGMLVFQDEEHLFQCADCLEIDYQNYNDAYESQYPTATAEELDKLDEINNFDHWQPFIDFENSLNFASLRANIERAIVAWEETPIADINPDDDPDDTTIILHENVRALFNEKGMAQIGKKVIGEDFFGDPGGIRVADACAWGYTEKYTFDQSDDPNLVNRQIKIKVAVHSGITRSKLKGKITHKRRRNGRMKRTRAHIRVGVIGRGMSDGGFGEECDISAQWWNKGAGSYKKRKVRRKSDRIWGLWREAVVDNSHPQWNVFNRCRARGEWNDGSQTYNLFLGDQ